MDTGPMVVHTTTTTEYMLHVIHSGIHVLVMVFVLTTAPLQCMTSLHFFGILSCVLVQQHVDDH